MLILNKVLLLKPDQWLRDKSTSWIRLTRNSSSEKMGMCDVFIRLLRGERGLRKIKKTKKSRLNL